MTKIVLEDLNISYGKKQVVYDVNLSLQGPKVIAFIGPSGCGKSTILRSINRMNDLIQSASVEGKILIDDTDINKKDVNVVTLRKKVGMVFQKANPFPSSIYNNIVYGLKIHNMCKSKQEMDEIVINTLKRVGLYSEVKDIWHESALNLSGGQQQRLCLARTIAIEPDVILMDEPCSALDPVATAVVENLITELASKYTIIIVTHSMQQAARVSEETFFFNMGRMVEGGLTKDIFTKPKKKETEDYLTGRIG